MSENVYHLTQVQEFTEVLPSGRWVKSYMLPGTTLMVVPGHDSARNIAPWAGVRLFRVWAAPMFYDEKSVVVSADQEDVSQQFIHWSGWVYLPAQAVEAGVWRAK